MPMFKTSPILETLIKGGKFPPLIVCCLGRSKVAKKIAPVFDHDVSMVKDIYWRPSECLEHHLFIDGDSLRVIVS
jgi:hypothetical protein